MNNLAVSFFNELIKSTNLGTFKKMKKKKKKHNVFFSFILKKKEKRFKCNDKQKLERHLPVSREL